MKHLYELRRNKIAVTTLSRNFNYHIQNCNDLTAFTLKKQLMTKTLKLKLMLIFSIVNLLINYHTDVWSYRN